MVERYRRRKGKKELLGNHQKCWIWGKNVVLETLRAGRWPVLELYLADRLDSKSLNVAFQLAQQSHIAATIKSSNVLTQQCHSNEHQGYLAKMAPYPYVDASQVVDNPPTCPLFTVLDSIQDPYNFGAIIRSANLLGVDAIFVARTQQVPVTSLVARSSAGAVNHVAISEVDNLTELAKRLRRLGVGIVAASQTAPINVFAANFLQPTAIVIGNEGVGIQDELLQVCDRRVSIPQFGNVDSLNSAVSAGILFYEARRQRQMSKARETDGT